MRELSGSLDALKFNRFVTAAAARCSQLLNYNALAEDADIDIDQHPGNAGDHFPAASLFQQRPQAHHQNAEAVFLRHGPCLLSHPLVLPGGGRKRGHERRAAGKLHRFRDHEELSECGAGAVSLFLPRPRRQGNRRYPGGRW